MNNISTQDYILWNTKKGCPVESLDTVYHHTSIVDLVNDGFTLKQHERKKSDKVIIFFIIVIM